MRIHNKEKTMKWINFKRLLIIFVFGAMNSVSAAQVYDYWFDECTWNGTTGEILDYSGNANDATAVGGFTTNNTTSVIDRSAYFDGVDDYVDTGKNLTILQYESASMSFWLKTTQTGNDITWQAPGISGAEEAGTTDDMYWGYIDAAGHIGLSVGDNNMVQSTSLINDDVWHHIVLTRNAMTSVGKVYVDGVLEASGVLNARNTFLEFQSIGRSEGVPAIYGGGYFNGYLDEVKLFNHTLSETEVGVIFNNDNTGKNYDGTVRPVAYNCQGPVPYPNNYTWATSVNGNLLTDTVDGVDTRVDTDPNGFIISINTYTQPEHGTVTVNPDGSFTYTADPGYVGPDTFTYTIINSNGDVSNRYSNVNLTATVANDDGYSTSQDTDVSGNVLDNDVYPAGTTITTDTIGLNGTLSMDSATGEFTFSPTPGFYGSTSFSYTLDDGNGNTSTATVRLTVEEAIVLPANLVAEYRMDECAFDGTTGDVIDNTINRLNGTSFANTAIAAGNTLCTAATFDGSGDYIGIDADPKLTFSTAFTVSAWVYTGNTVDTGSLVSQTDLNNNTGWSLEIFDGSQGLRFYFNVNGYNGWVRDATTTLSSNTWYHVVGVYNSAITNELTLYVNSAPTSKSYDTSYNSENTRSLKIGGDVSPGITDFYTGALDEVKIFNRAFSATQVTSMYTNELARRNWNQNNTYPVRECNTCQCTAKAGSNMVSLPADLRNMNDKTIGNVITGDLINSYNYGAGDDWQMAGRTYDIVTDNKNDASYDVLDDTSATLEYGKAYWIANRTGTDINYEANLKTMDFNATVTDYPSCRSANGKCALIELQEPNGTDNNGPYIYNMTSFSVQKPIRWENVRILITDGGQRISYTPDQAAALEETFNATIWRYDQDGTNYTNVTPGTPGLINTIDPCSGYWIELDKNTAGKRVQLLIPEE